MRELLEQDLIRRALQSDDPNVLRLALQLVNHPDNYRDDPVRFCRNTLGVTLWSKQTEIAEALLKYRRVLVKSANAVGKTKAAACLALWHFMTRQGITLITAPTYRQVSDVTFKEVRRLYGKRPGIYPKEPRIQTAPDHYLHGFTTTDDTSFQGVHEASLMIVFEECVGIDASIWEAANSILMGGDTYWLAICNPTDTASEAYMQELTGRWHVISISALDHPNIPLEQAGNPPLIPGAIRLDALRKQLADWCEIVPSPEPTDLTFEGRHYRPGAVAEARLLGRYPSQGSYSIFSEAAFNAARTSTAQPHPIADQHQGGCDVARFGDDLTSIHIRRGCLSVHHESYNGRDTAFTAARLKQLADQYGGKKTAIKIDDAGVGGGVVDQREDYSFIGINGANRATNDREYPNKRSEALFALADMMNNGEVNLSQLPQEQFAEIKRQAMGITYKLDNKGRRVAERKDETKKRLKRSPDDLDALALAYLSYATHNYEQPKPKEKRPFNY